MDRFSFWQKWLLIVSLMITIFGLALAFLNQTPLFDMLFNDQVYFNVLFNLVILLLIGLPLVFTREYFNKAAQGAKP